jgi:signal recognition particle receptor subunit beta/GAF domain-containing protein
VVAVVDINQKDRTIRVKIVYYGPALGGKTTNLRVLHERALWSRRGEFVSVNSMQDRTILCDLLPLRTGGFRGYDLKVQLLAVPGQVMYDATRRVVLRAADGVVFVANSATDRFHENARSQEEMAANLVAHQLDPHTIPLVFQYNKRDLPQVVDFEALQRELNARHVPAFQAVAPRGAGVLETFSAILGATVADLCRRYRTMELPPGQSVEAWTAQAVAGMFGRERLDTPAGEAHEEIELPDGTVIPIESSDHLRVKVTTPEDAPRTTSASPSEARSPESLAGSYAEASAELGFVVSNLREERDAARTRLEEMRRALELATEAPGTTDVQMRLRRILQVLVQAGGASSAALRLTVGDAPQILSLPPLVSDPLSRTDWGNTHLEALRDLAEPLLEEAVESAELTDALRASEPSYEAVVLVPLRSAERLLGLGLLYYDLHAVMPSRDTLSHLGFLARELAGPLEASAAREASSAAQRLGVLSRASAAAVASLLARLPPESARRQRLDLAEVLAPLRVPGITLHLPPQGMTVLGDAPLIRFALVSLVHVCEIEQLERRQAPEIVIRGAFENGVPCVSVSSVGRASVLAPRQTGPDLSEAELSVVQAVVAAHDGELVQEHDAGEPLRFTLRLRPA